jgi:hypothetical protein
MTEQEMREIKERFFVLETCGSIPRVRDDVEALIVEKLQLQAERDAFKNVASQQLDISVKLSEKNERLQAEIGAAVADLSLVAYAQRNLPCTVCKHLDNEAEEYFDSKCFGCTEIESHFEWRGLKGENNG